MRKVILDLETTGLRLNKDKIVEIAMIELNENNEFSGNFFHSYINPQRTIPRMVSKVHGIYWPTIKSAPIFDEIKNDILQFIQNKELLSYHIFNLQILNCQLGFKLDTPTTDILKLTRDIFSFDSYNQRLVAKKLKIKDCPLFNNELLHDCYKAWKIYQKVMKQVNCTDFQA